MPCVSLFISAVPGCCPFWSPAVAAGVPVVGPEPASLAANVLVTSTISWLQGPALALAVSRTNSVQVIRTRLGPFIGCLLPHKSGIMSLMTAGETTARILSFRGNTCRAAESRMRRLLQRTERPGCATAAGWATASRRGDRRWRSCRRDRARRIVAVACWPEVAVAASHVLSLINVDGAWLRAAAPIFACRPN